MRDPVNAQPLWFEEMYREELRGAEAGADDGMRA